MLCTKSLTFTIFYSINHQSFVTIILFFLLINYNIIIINVKRTVFCHIILRNINMHKTDLLVSFTHKRVVNTNVPNVNSE